MSEFSFIENHLKPLTFGHREALSLKDDAAIIPQKPGYDLIITKDSIAEDTHFFKNDTASNIAKKLLRSNLSDLAAKGAKPYCCFLALILPNNINQQWLQEFTISLKNDLQEFDCFLAGGDTTTHKGGIVLSLTALGYSPEKTAIKRSGASVGDLIFVTGTIGDSYLGLKILEGNYPEISAINKAFLTQRYHVPNPRIKTGLALRQIATSCTDISDGLMADMGHICSASNVGAEIFLNQIPHSPAGLEIKDPNFPINSITKGDDYELIFTIPPKHQEKILQISNQTNINITQIGQITKATGIKLLTHNNQEIQIQTPGYQHML